jgi:hypothetical protein
MNSPPPLSPQEIQALRDRIVLSDATDRRGWEIRMLAYAEKMSLLPRLVQTVADLQDRAARYDALNEQFQADLRAAHDPAHDGPPGFPMLDELCFMGMLEASASLRDALGHSNCYCERCSVLSRQHWYPKPQDRRRIRPA